MTYVLGISSLLKFGRKSGAPKQPVIKFNRRKLRDFDISNIKIGSLTGKEWYSEISRIFYAARLESPNLRHYFNSFEQYLAEIPFFEQNSTQWCVSIEFSALVGRKIAKKQGISFKETIPNTTIVLLLLTARAELYHAEKNKIPLSKVDFASIQADLDMIAETSAIAVKLYV